MARIDPLNLQTASERARPLLEALNKRLGAIPNLYATIAHAPESLAAVLGAMEGLSARGKLSGREAEQINLYVSELNACGYCVSAHTVLARKMGLSPDDIALAREGRGANPREQAILALVRRVVRAGGVGAGAELAAAREAGLGDGEVVEVLHLVALRSFANSVALVAQTDLDFPRAPRLPQL